MGALSEFFSPDSNSSLSLRVKTGVPAALGMVLILTYGPVWILGVLVAAAAGVCMKEYGQILSSKWSELPGQSLLLASVVIAIAPLLGGESTLVRMLLLSTFLFILWSLLTKENDPLEYLGLSLFGLIWIPVGLSYATLIHSLDHGVSWLFLVLFIIWANDVFAYFGGKFLGKRLLAPQISPKKTLEGSAFGVLGGVLMGAIWSTWIEPLSLLGSFVFAIVLCFAGQAGDLVESRVKRLSGVKDSGHILPGHGGLLDRLDALLLALPLAYYWISSGSLLSL